MLECVIEFPTNAAAAIDLQFRLLSASMIGEIFAANTACLR
jgi:hypothetical protein